MDSRYLKIYEMILTKMTNNVNFFSSANLNESIANESTENEPISAIKSNQLYFASQSVMDISGEHITVNQVKREKDM